ncbi:hypothetical protein CRUP_036420 [Coryphaenoides rupestris]|nr:hypothetical protein CRUP_036420 [Coryphaenoides rupestris]
MEEQATVVFRNVGQVYFPETRVECHYSIASEHPWSPNDWIGLFPVGWSSVKDYHTYTWALVPEGYTAGADVNSCALFHSFYLPRPGPTEYQFVYVAEGGEVCGRSRNFTFCSPKPLDELETMKEERGEEEEEGDGDEEEMLLSRLEDSMKEQEGVRLQLQRSQREQEMQMNKHKVAREEWECERAAMQREISQLTKNLGCNSDKLRTMEGKHKDVKETGASLSSELSRLRSEREEGEQRIRALEEDVRVLSASNVETDAVLGRMKERVKKMCDQIKHEEEKRKSAQAEHQAARAEVRALRERLVAGERTAEALRRELAELSLLQGSTHGELHQTRLQAARFTLQLSEQDLLLREARASWALEQDACRHTAQEDQDKLQQLSLEVQSTEEWLRDERLEREKLEIELGRERDCNRVMLGDARREAQELKAQLRTVQKEREQWDAEKRNEKEQHLDSEEEGDEAGMLSKLIAPVVLR